MKFGKANSKLKLMETFLRDTVRQFVFLVKIMAFSGITSPHTVYRVLCLVTAPQTYRKTFSPKIIFKTFTTTNMYLKE